MLAQQFRVLLQIVGESLVVACLQCLLHVPDTVSGQLMLVQHLRNRVAVGQDTGRFQVAEQDVLFLGMVEGVGEFPDESDEQSGIVQQQSAVRVGASVCGIALHQVAIGQDQLMLLHEIFCYGHGRFTGFSGLAGRSVESKAGSCDCCYLYGIASAVDVSAVARALAMIVL